MSDESYPPGCHTIPTSTGMSPTTAENDETDVAVTVTGANFWQGTQIVFDGVRMPTTWNGSNQVTAHVSMVGRPVATVLVRVRNGNRRVSSTARNFAITVPA